MAKDTGRTISLSRGIPKARATCWAIRGQPHEGFRLLVSTIGIDECFGRSFGPGISPVFWAEKSAVLSVSEGFVEVPQGEWFQYDSGADQTGRVHEQGAQSCDETIPCP
jgi:hypothetical protein